MNIVRQLRKKKGIQQKQLALEIGVSQPTVSDWESNKTDPSGERLKKLAEYFDVDELFILGYGMEQPNTFVPENPKTAGVSETEQIVQYVLDRLNVSTDQGSYQTKTPEARSLAKGIDKMPQSQREAIQNMMISLYPGIFEKGEDNNDA